MLLAGLEHLDERYLRAVGYTTKSKRGALPKMVLFGDIVGEDEAAVAAATSQVVRIANARRGEGFIAVSAEARRKFWLDRARTAAIARHTNAFKINEDVVIPLERMGEYTDAIERINIELSIRNKLELLDCAGCLFLRRDQAAGNDRGCRRAARTRRRRSELLARVRGSAGSTCLGAHGCARTRRIRARALRSAAGSTIGSAGSPRCARRCSGFSAARHLRRCWRECEPSTSACCSGRVFVALHMHAGDGNVHTNIPVNSDDYAMLQTANRAVARIMGIARDLDGVISGEHGIGITKLEFLTDAETRRVPRLQAAHRSAGPLQPRQADAGRRSRRAYTPSFNLLGHESLIMQQSDIGSISDAIKDCLRCGKCKPVCATHVPRANLLYSPRDKILATSLLIEAFLYEEQTRRGVSVRHWDEFADVADHCTVCHKCESPCPVDIDFGDVSMAMRDLLRRMGKKRFNAGTAASMFFLNATNPRDHQAGPQG